MSSSYLHIPIYTGYVAITCTVAGAGRLLCEKGLGFFQGRRYTFLQAAGKMVKEPAFVKGAAVGAVMWTAFGVGTLFVIYKNNCRPGVEEKEDNSLKKRTLLCFGAVYFGGKFLVKDTWKGFAVSNLFAGGGIMLGAISYKALLILFAGNGD